MPACLLRPGVPGWLSRNDAPDLGHDLTQAVGDILKTGAGGVDGRNAQLFEPIIVPRRDVAAKEDRHIIDTFVLHPLLEQLGPKKTSAPLAGNITASATKVTGALLQYEPVPVTPEKACTSDSDCGTGGDICYKDRCTDDGHFVVFHDPRAIRQYGRFLATLARHGYPTVSP